VSLAVVPFQTQPRHHKNQLSYLLNCWCLT